VKINLQMVINDRKGDSLNKSISAINQSIREILSRHQKVRLEAPWRNPSGVLIPLYAKDGRHFLVLTRRSQVVRHHKGEISFPGGGYQESDGNLRQTALRESQEEIGLDPSEVDILGELDDTPTRGSDFIITPFVGLIPADYPFKLSDFEIGELICIPVEALLPEDCCRAGPEVRLDDRLYRSYEYTFLDKQVIGATGRILKQFLEIYCQAAV
jgi:8-oxo-dGTP pyrophosphatase MutT (NUDIX family)